MCLFLFAFVRFLSNPLPQINVLQLAVYHSSFLPKKCFVLKTFLAILDRLFLTVGMHIAHVRDLCTLVKRCASYVRGLYQLIKSLS